LDGAGEAAVAGGVAGAVHAEHALATGDDLAGGLADRVERVVLAAGDDLFALGLVAHRMRPFISLVGSAFRPASSSSVIWARRLAPSLVCWTWSCSFRIASISISGLGGQPGRYMSTGTTWSTPCTIA